MMKRLLLFSVAAALLTLPIMTMAATKVTPAKELTNGAHLQKMGTISAWGDSSNDAEVFLSTEATHQGATSYTIISMRDIDGQMYGTAVLYK